MSRFIWIFISIICAINKCDSYNHGFEDSLNYLGPPSHTHVFKEGNPGLSTRADVKKQIRAHHDHSHEVIFVVQQKNMDKLTLILDDLSDPSSPNYGQHWTRQEVVDFTSNSEGRDAVVSYLHSNGALVTSETLTGEFISAQAPIKVWERVFNTEFNSYIQTHFDKTSERVIRAEHYSIPRELDEHVLAVLNTIDIHEHVFKVPQRIPFPLKTTKFSNTDFGYMTPNTIKSYYNMSLTTTGSINSTQAIFASVGQNYSPLNLAEFQEFNGYAPNPAVREYGNHANDTICRITQWTCAEANLDMQYSMTLSTVSPTTFWYTDSWFNAWLLEVSNSVDPPKILSMSYGASEDTVTASLHTTFSSLAIRLSTMGVTLITASGDDGVNSHAARYDAAKCGYSPTFPSTNPYVISVGGTSVSRTIFQF